MLALCAAVLASCSATSDPITRLGLAPQPQAGGLAAAATEADDPVAAAGSDQPYFIVAEDDPELPEVASAVPALQNRPEPAEAPQLASATQAPVVATLDERFAAGQQATGPAAEAAPVAQAGADAVAAVQAAAPVESSSAFAPPPKKRSGFFASLFASEPYQPAPQRTAAAKPRPLIDSVGSVPAAPAQRAAMSPGALPGVREGALFEISRKTGTGDDDIDLMEDDEGPVQLASAAGLARLAPNGLAVQTDRVDVACLKPSLVRVLKQVEAKYGKKVVVTSGYRSPPNNRRARGATNSLHMYCAAADIQVEGVTKFELAQFARSMPGRGGVGTYCHTNSVHIDVGPERDWNWRCRRKKRR